VKNDPAQLVFPSAENHIAFLETNLFCLFIDCKTSQLMVTPYEVICAGILSRPFTVHIFVISMVFTCQKRIDGFKKPVVSKNQTAI
jgi:hypothetical protein